MTVSVKHCTPQANSPWHVAVPAAVELGEHPLWDVRRQRLFWTDCAAGTVHCTDLSHDTVVWSAPDGAPVGVALLRACGGLAIATRAHVVLLDNDGRADRAPLELPIDTAAVRFNDGSCDPVGRLLVGTTGGNVDGLGELFSVDADGRVCRLLGDLTEANGIGWSPDGRSMYFVDSGRPVMYVFDYDVGSGRLGECKEFARIDPELGYLDGLTVDEAGNVWVAIWDGGRLHRYAPDGQLRDVIDVPVSRPTCPAFGGGDLRTLYVTTARGDVGEPCAGHVLASPGAGRGIVPHRFAG
ncbi:SMP-30/gluconolactonase/LRE family protein [Mycolicibacterium mageritense]|uniref:6-deoxy-6-sulfogluconolactonase n=1 Tax=Mycolicibacterium mageritense TaxID=53462 RepID=A0AAI8XNE0_MYCME|nr:SMP-30/gluconolactonase/LRE family protein [Mycolicibacterium mageritense]TXI55334.1 MAG: SMP-30/gluconolactonase/LRE family protein [Mycolicibacterium mageritense]BDY28797.1 6-deoxy-6-sulfogluconolactonase [Mycolicibacterium mageritense]